MVFDVVLLKNFSCKKNGVEINFPFKKTAILFAYLVINKEAQRKDLAKLLWSNVDESEIRKNLRNALYTLRKVIDPDIILTEGNSRIYLNPEYTYNCDYTDILVEKDCHKIIESYGDFLNDITLNKIDTYQKWVSDVQNNLLNIYIDACDKLINEYQEQEQYDKALEMLQQKVKYYQYDEASYREIMNIYFKKNEFDKAIEAYTTINNILSNNLNINCEQETFELYEKIVNKKISMLKSAPGSNLSMHNELIFKKLIDAYESLIKYDHSSFILLNGETGSGKTFLINRFLSTTKKKDIELFKILCYKNDNDYVFRSIEPFIKELEYRYKTLSFGNLLTLAFKESNMDYKQNTPYIYFDKYFINMLQKVLSNHKIVLIVEDIHYMDITSLTLFNKLMQADLKNLIIIFTKSMNREVNLAEKMDVYDVVNWSHDEAKGYLKKRANVKVSDELVNNIMRVSKGNPYHIKSIVSLDLTNKIDIDDVFNVTYQNLSEQEKRVIDILAIFIRSISLNNLNKLVSIPNLELIETLRKLEEKEMILSHKSNTGIIYQIANEAFKEYVYQNLNKYVKRQLHNTIANNFENSTFDDQTSVYLYQLLIDHFNSAFNKVKELEYLIKYHSIKNYCTCELFSIMEMSLMDSLYLNHDHNFETILSELEEELIELSSNNLTSSKFEDIAILFYVMKARYYLNKLDNEKSLEALEVLMELTDNDRDIIKRHNTYYLMIYYAINSNNYSLLNEVLAKLLKSIKSLDNYSIEYTKSMITYSRFKGFYHLSNNNYEKAINYFKKALLITHNTIFNLDVTYQASIYYYLGQAYLVEKRYKEAVDCFIHCLKLLMKDNLLVDAILNTKGYMAIAYYLNSDYSKAKSVAQDYFNNNSYRSFNWKIGLLNTCLSIISDKEIEEENDFSNNLDQEIYKLVYNKSIKA